MNVFTNEFSSESAVTIQLYLTVFSDPFFGPYKQNFYK